MRLANDYGKLSAVMFRASRHQSSLGRTGAALVVVALLIASVFSAAPQLHERFHADAGAPTHHCAASLISAGHCSLEAAPPIAVAPTSLIVLTVSCLTNATAIVPSPHSSVLEHAPPVFA